MSSLYRSPLRVYLALAVVSFVGIWSALHLPISLFPNSSKPYAGMCIGIDLSPDNFLKTYGTWIEGQIRAIQKSSLEVEKVVAHYQSGRACYDIDFKWGGDNDEAKREMEGIVANLQGRLPQSSRDRVQMWAGREGSFFILSFFSATRSMTDTYKILEPVLVPRLSRVRDAQEPVLYNPQQRQILIELKPESLATFQLFPNDIAEIVMRALESYGGGSLTIATGSMTVDFPRSATTIETLQSVPIRTPGGRVVTLGDVAKLDLTVPLDSSRIFKTSGAPSVILFVSTKPGGNVKSMAEETKAIVEEVMPNLPPDIQYKVLVDPSEYIRSAVSNVAKEVAIAAGLAVIILFLFIGNIKNVATAAIEIPLSIVLAFILMRMSGMNLNMISLGGLALSAGMNVDASVVVMENIFSHFEKAGGRKMNFEERLALIVRAVKEVQFSVVASTIASLVVFIPLAFTSDLSYAILGDLAKAVVFSHGFSAIVALILVPTVRLHLMKNGMTHEKPALLENPLRKLEESYARALGYFLESRTLKVGSLVGLAALLILLSILVAPSLKREIIGKPDTDALVFGLRTSGNTLTRQMEAQTEEIEAQILQTYGDQIAYTFTQINRPNSGHMILRLKDKTTMESLYKSLEQKFPNTPTTRFFIEPWNPGEMPLPDPADFQMVVRGSDREAISLVARDIEVEFNERKLFARTSVEPNASREEALRIRPRAEQWPLLAAQGGPQLSLGVLADLSRTALGGRTIINAEFDSESMDVFMRFPERYVQSPEELGALPIGAGSRILPLKALAQIKIEKSAPEIRRENGREAYLITGRGEKGEEKQTKENVKKATSLIENWPALEKERGRSATKSTLQIEDAQVEMNDALRQLGFAVSLSVGLIFLTMVFQFGSLMNALLVLVSVPLGFIGVMISLFVFNSTLSLNSLLGVILLNGLAVANSIILVDFLQRKVKEGVSPRLAAVEVGRARLRPILMTSLTTGLGMLPIALGFGEGGKILQPLGIAVAGGLCFSLVTTLFIVPFLQVAWIEWHAPRFTHASKVVTALLVGVLLSPSANAATGSLNFADAYKTILDRDLKVRTQRAQFDSSEYLETAEWGDLAPKLALTATEAQAGDPYRGRARGAGVTASVNLFRSGGDLAGIRAARSRVKSDREKLFSERQLAEDNAIEAITVFIARAQAKSITEKIVNLRQESLRVARERFKKGLLPMQEVDKVSVDLANSQAKLIDAQNIEMAARAALIAALGHDRVTMEWPWRRIAETDTGIESAKFDLERVPDWRALKHSVDVASNLKRESLGALLPTLDFQVSYGNQDLSDSDRKDWQTLITLSVPLFNGFRDHSNYQIRGLNQRVAEYNLETYNRLASSNIESLRLSYQTAKSSAVARANTAKVSEKLYTDNQQRFRLGRASVNELSYDQERLFQAQLLEIEGWLNLHTSYSKLCHALGSYVVINASSEPTCQANSPKELL